MAQASVLTDPEIRRVFRIIETTRHADRNRLAFVLSLYAGLRVGEIAALTIGDVLTQKGEVRREIKLDPRQTKGSKGRTVVLSSRVRTEIVEYVRTHRIQRHDAPLISSQRNASAFSNVTLSMLFKEIYELAGIRTSSHSGRRTFATRLNARGVGMRTIQKLMGHSETGRMSAFTPIAAEKRTSRRVRLVPIGGIALGKRPSW